MHEIKEKGVVNLPTGLCCFMEMHKHEGPNSHFLAAAVMGLGGVSPRAGSVLETHSINWGGNLPQCAVQDMALGEPTALCCQKIWIEVSLGGRRENRT